MVKIVASLAFLLTAAPALAQNAAPPRSSELVALERRLMSEIQTSLQCTTAYITLQQRVTELETKLKEATEPKPKK